jgi:hypothetical protein
LASRTLLLLALLAVQEEGVVQDRKDFIPDSEKPRPVEAGKHVMALVTRPLTLIDPKEVRPGDHSLVLSASGGGYRWCYITTPTGKHEPATIDNTLQFGVTRNFSLVEVDVVERGGSPSGGPALIARSMRVVEEYPIRPHKVVAEMRAKYETWAKDQNVAEAMEKARAAAKGDEKRTKPSRSATMMHVQWMEETQKLQVRFLTRVLTTDDVARPYSGPRLGNPPAPRPIWWGIEFGALYEVDKSGALEKRLTLPMESWSGESTPRPVLDLKEYK